MSNAAARSFAAPLAGGPAHSSEEKSSFENTQAQASPDRGLEMGNSRGSTNRRLRGDSRTSLHAKPDRQECKDWLKENLAPVELGEVAQDAGFTKRAAENIKGGENGIRMENLVAFCRNNPAFRAAFIEFVGGEVALPAEITLAINAYVHRTARQG